MEKDDDDDDNWQASLWVGGALKVYQGKHYTKTIAIGFHRVYSGREESVINFCK